MRFLIDGYNLIFSAGIGGVDDGPGALRRARTMMLHDVRKHLTTEEARSTTVVFDAKQAPPGLPDELEQHGIRVLFARNHDEADDLIEELLRQHSAPRKLTIVTSDLRLRQAAARRRARSLTIDEWLDFLEDRESQSPPTDKDRIGHAESSRERARDVELLTNDQIEAWMKEFDIQTTTTPRHPKPPKPASPEDEPPARSNDRTDHTDREFDWGPFPPGYGEDLL